MSTGFSFGTGGGFAATTTNTLTSATTTNPTGFSFGFGGTGSAVTSSTTSAPAAAASAGQLKFPTFNAATATTNVTNTVSSFGFNAPNASSNSSSSLFNPNPTAATVSSASSGLGGFNLFKPSTASTFATTTSVSSGLFSAQPQASSTAVVAGSTPSVFNAAATGASLSTATATTTLGGSANTASTISMRQLEEKLNKWLVELKEQEERFMRQASHVNEWDQILQKGHDQVQTLKTTLDTVKCDQSRLEAEIDFIRSQQDELERLLEPLEASTLAAPSNLIHQGDRHRDNMYHLAQSLDAQLRQMTDDLARVIEHVNANSSNVQTNDPMTSVTRILSAHMDTLKWIDQNTANLSNKVDEVAKVAASTAKRT